MYLQSQTLFGTSNLFITSSHIYDIVINEVCENVSSISDRINSLYY